METVGFDALEGQEQEGGSTDVGDVSWVMPTLHLSVATAPHDAPWHAWPVVASGGMSIGHKGMLRRAKTLAATMVDLYDEPQRACGARRVRAQDARLRVQGVHPRRPAATAERRIAHAGAGGALGRRAGSLE